MIKQLGYFLFFFTSFCLADSPLDVSHWDFDVIQHSHKTYKTDHKNMGDIPPYLIPFSQHSLTLFDSKRGKLAQLEVGKLASSPIMSADGFHAFVALKDGWIKKIDLKTGQTNAEIRVGLSVATAALSGDGRVLLVGNKQPADLVFLNADDLHLQRIIPVKTYNGLMSPVTMVRNTGDEHGFIVTAKDFIKLWKISYLNPPPIGFGDGWNHDYRCLKEHVDKPLFPVKRLKTKQKINNFYVNDEATFLVGKSETGKGLIMDLDLSRVIERPDYLDIHPNLLWDYKNSKRLASLSEDKNQLLIYSNEKNSRHWETIKKLAVDHATAVGSCPQSDQLWVADKNGKILLIGKESLETEKSLDLNLGSPIKSLACTKDDKYMFIGTSNTVAVFDKAKQKIVNQLNH